MGKNRKGKECGKGSPAKAARSFEHQNHHGSLCPCDRCLSIQRRKTVRAKHHLRETLTHLSAAEQRIFSPIRAVQKVGNTQSIPPPFEPSAGEKSLAVSSCQMNQSFPGKLKWCADEKLVRNWCESSSPNPKNHCK